MSKLIAAVVHDVVRADTFASLADLAEAVKGRCATLKIPYDAGTVTDAIHLVERTRPVLVTRPATANPRHIERPDDASPLSRAEAADLMSRLIAAWQREQARRSA